MTSRRALLSLRGARGARHGHRHASCSTRPTPTYLWVWEGSSAPARSMASSDFVPRDRACDPRHGARTVASASHVRLATSPSSRWSATPRLHDGYHFGIWLPSHPTQLTHADVAAIGRAALCRLGRALPRRALASRSRLSRPDHHGRALGALHHPRRRLRAVRRRGRRRDRRLRRCRPGSRARLRAGPRAVLHLRRARAPPFGPSARRCSRQRMPTTSGWPRATGLPRPSIASRSSSPDSVRRVGALFGAELPEVRMAR